MKEAIMQILKDNAWEMEKDRYVIGLSNIDNIAEEIVKLFLIPPVIKSVCPKCDGKGWYFVNEWIGSLQGRKDCKCKGQIYLDNPDELE